MRKLSSCHFTIFVFISFLLAFINSEIVNNPKGSFSPFLEQNPKNHLTSKKGSPKAEQDLIVVTFVVCGSRLREALNMVRSVLIFSMRPVHFVVFSDDKLRSILKKILRKWKVLTINQLSFELHQVNFPKKNDNFWMRLFSICSAQRLFFPNLLTHIDSMIYVDIDTLFLGSVEKLWQIFSKFNSSQIAAIARENEHPMSWYPVSAKHPFFGKLGLAAGVILMNLTRMRSFGWTKYMAPIAKRWQRHLIWGDQDIINIIFHNHPEAVLLLNCRFNYRYDHCYGGHECTRAAKRGAFLLHGSRRAFHKDNNQPAFEAIYRAIEEYKVGTDPSETLLINMEMYFAEIPPSSLCISLKHVFFKVPEQTLRRLYGKPVR